MFSALFSHDQLYFMTFNLTQQPNTDVEPETSKTENKEATDHLEGHVSNFV